MLRNIGGWNVRKEFGALMDYVNVQILDDLLAVGTVGFVIGVLLPLGFRLIAYVVDSVKVVIRGGF